MITLSQVDQIGNLQNCYDISASTVCCIVCGDLLPSVLSYHNHNINKHTCHELSLGIIKLFCLQLGQKSELKEKIKDFIFECDNLYYKNNELNNKSHQAVQSDISKEENFKGTEHETGNISNNFENEQNEDIATKNGQFTIEDFSTERGKDCVIRTDKRKSESKNKNLRNNFNECNNVTSKGIKLEEEVLKENRDLNLCDYLVAEEVFLQPHDYTEEGLSTDSGIKEADVVEADDSLQSLIQDENYIQINSNNTFEEYDHPQIMHHSESESENGYEFIPIVGSEMDGNDSLNSDLFSPSDSISLASLIFLILQNSVEGLTVPIIDVLLQGLFPYFFKNLSYSYAKCDMLDLIRKTLRKEEGFRKTKKKGIGYTDPIWEITSSIARYEEEIHNSSVLNDFTQSPELVKALKKREVKIDINSHGLPIISYTPQQQRSLQEGKGGENITFNQGFNDHCDRNIIRLHDQDPFAIKSEVRPANNNTELLTDVNHNRQDLKDMMQNRFSEINTENGQVTDIYTPKRKKFKKDQDLPKALLEKETSILNLENSCEWDKIENIHVKTEPLVYDPRNQEYDPTNQEYDPNNQNVVYDNANINDYIHNGEEFFDIDTDSQNILRQSNKRTFKNGTDLAWNKMDFEGSKKKQSPQNIFDQNCSSESYQQSTQQRIPCNVLYEQNNVSIEDTMSQETHPYSSEEYHNDQELTQRAENKDQEPIQNTRRRRIPCKLKMSFDEETDKRKPPKKKQRRKQSSSKSDALNRNLNTHRISEQMRRKELNEQFDHLMKRLPEYGLGRSIPKIAILDKSRKYISKLRNINDKLLMEKEKQEEYQQILINRLKNHNRNNFL